MDLLCIYSLRWLRKTLKTGRVNLTLRDRPLRAHYTACTVGYLVHRTCALFHNPLLFPLCKVRTEVAGLDKGRKLNIPSRSSAFGGRNNRHERKTTPKIATAALIVWKVTFVPLSFRPQVTLCSFEETDRMDTKSLGKKCTLKNHEC